MILSSWPAHDMSPGEITPNLGTGSEDALASSTQLFLRCFK